MKRAIVTGANSGIGLETTKELAKQGFEVIMVCRDKLRGKKVQAEIIKETKNKKIYLMICDLASQKSIRKFSNDFKKKYKHLDVLINNAGVALDKLQFTEDNIERTFAVNHLGYFLLTNLLLDVLKKTPNSRIVNVASDVHKRVKLNLNDIQRVNDWSGFKSYANSKLCNIYFTYELARRLKGTGVTVNSLSPGLVKSNLFRHKKSLPLFDFLKNLIGKTPKKGAETMIYLATSSDVNGVSGKYFTNSKMRRTSKRTHSLEIAKRLWDESVRLTKFKE